MLTPHDREYERFGRPVGPDRVGAARALAAELGACVLLKGSTTVVAAAGGAGPVVVNPTGTGWLATAGSGDVLSGVTGALLAAGLGEVAPRGGGVRARPGRPGWPPTARRRPPSRSPTPSRPPSGRSPATGSARRPWQDRRVIGTPRAQARIDVAAVRANVAELCPRAGDAQVLAVVKADAYGHGLVPCAQAAVDGGATWLGTALLEEALALRAAGVGAEGGRPRVLAWLLDPADPFADAVRADVDLSASAPWTVAAAQAAAEDVRAGRPGCTSRWTPGLGRAGAQPADWPELVDAALKAAATGAVEVVGVWSHLAHADDPHHPTVDRQLAIVPEARRRRRAGRRATAGPAPGELRGDPDPAGHPLRPGPPGPGGLRPVARPPSWPRPAELGLRPAMRLSGRVALAKRVPAGHGVSYLHRYVTDRETTLALVPLGYADGVPRAGTNVGPLLAAGAAAHRRRHGLHGPAGGGRRRRRRRTRATRSCCSVPATTASRPRRTGPTRPGRSPTRSSPGSGRGCRARWWARERRPRAGVVGAGLGLVAAGVAAGSVLGSALERRVLDGR